MRFEALAGPREVECFPKVVHKTEAELANVGINETDTGSIGDGLAATNANIGHKSAILIAARGGAAMG